MLRWAIDATALALILAAAQGCSSTSSSAAPDASTEASTNVDGGTDAPTEAGPPPPDCGSMPPTGTQVVASTDPLAVLTLTTDNHAIYENLTTQEVYGVALAGGMPSDIGKMTSQVGTIWAHGSGVLYLPIAADPQTSIAPISSWTAAGGTSVISTSALAYDSYYYTYDVSADGQNVAYFATTDSMTATLTVSTIDGKTQKPLVTGVDLTDQSCSPMLQFVNDILIVQYCVLPTATEDAGTPAETTTIAVFTAPTFAPVTLGTTFLQPPGGFVQVDPTGKLALLLDPAGTGLSLYPLAGGSSVTVDPTGVSGLFTATGDIIYTTSNAALMRYTAATAMTIVLVPSGVVAPVDLSPDGNWLQVTSKQDATTELMSLYIVSATTPGAANSVVPTATTSPAGFTTDSQYSVFGTNFPPDFGPVTYDLEASKTSGGAAAKVLSASGRAFFTSGAKLVSNTNQSKSTGSADIVSLDLSTTAAPTTLVTQANPNLFQPSASQIVYSWYCNENAMAGVWTLTPP